MTSPHEDRRVANRSSSRRHSAQVPAVSGGGERNNETNEERRPAALSSGRGRSSSSNRSPPVARGQRHVGQWTEKQLLGSGGFGQVILWQNESSGDWIALKTCRADLSETNRQRWRMEVQMMYRLSHPNLVTAIRVPECFLDLAKHNLEILGMEWCDKGSLREWFSVPEHRCGLPETGVLLLMKDIAGAIEYLHEQRIIHRDIKPENVVLKEANGRVFHKLIDLGYAKELDHRSMAKSFVGTFVYLAPELFLNTQQYTRSVDYWNFGSIVYEAITGQRPFPDFHLSPITWHQKVSTKGKHDICMHKPDNSMFVYSQDIIPPHWLSRPMEALLTDWLRLMLQLDAHMRGGVIDPSNKRPEAFNFLDRILKINIVQFHCINLNRTVAFEASSNDWSVTTSITVYQNQLAQEWQIPKENQSIFDRSGWEPEPERLILENVMGKPSLEAGDGQEQYHVVTYCVLDNRKELDADMVIQAAAVPPPTVKSFVVDDPHSLMSQEDCSRIWPLAMNFCMKQLEQCKSLLNGTKAILLNCLRENTSLSRLKGQLALQSHKLEGMLEFFFEDLRHDIAMMTFSLNGQGFNEAVTRWNAVLEEISQMRAHQHLSSMEAHLTEVHSQMSQIQSSQAVQSAGQEALQEIVTQSRRLLLTVKRQSKELKDSQAMADCIHRCIEERDKLIRHLFSAVKNMIAFKSSASQVTSKVKAALESVQKCRIRLSELRQQKQTSLWEMVKSLDTAFTRDSSVSRSISAQSEIGSMTSSLSSLQLASLTSVSRQNSGAATKEVIEESGVAMTEFTSVLRELKKNVSQVESLARENADAQ